MNNAGADPAWIVTDAQQILKDFSEPRSGEENVLGLLGGLGACSPSQFWKYDT